MQVRAFERYISLRDCQQGKYEYQVSQYFFHRAKFGL